MRLAAFCVGSTIKRLEVWKIVLRNATIYTRN